MRDFKYRALVVGKPAGWDSMKAPRSESLRPIAEAFKANLERAQTFTFAPAEISFLVRRNRTWAIYAIFKITGKVSPDLRIGIEERHGKEFQKQVDVLVKEFDSLP